MEISIPPLQVVHKVGLCIVLHDILQVGDSYIFPGDGASHTKGSVYVCVCMHVYVCVYVCICMYVYVCVCVCMCMFVV